MSRKKVQIHCNNKKESFLLQRLACLLLLLPFPSLFPLIVFSFIGMFSFFFRSFLTNFKTGKEGKHQGVRICVRDCSMDQGVKSIHCMHARRRIGMSRMGDKYLLKETCLTFWQSLSLSLSCCCCLVLIAALKAQI